MKMKHNRGTLLPQMTTLALCMLGMNFSATAQQDTSTVDGIELEEVVVTGSRIFRPEFQYRFSATYRLENFSSTWSTRYLDRSFLLDISPTGDIEEDQSPAFVASNTTHDLSVNYAINENIAVYGGVRNVFDEVPAGNINNALYDLIGRRAFFGIRASY